MIRLSEIITTFAFELERHEKTCRDEGSILYRAFCNYPRTEMWKFQYQKDDGNAAHAWIIISFSEGMIYLIAWAIAYYF